MQRPSIGWSGRTAHAGSAANAAIFAGDGFSAQSADTVTPAEGRQCNCVSTCLINVPITAAANTILHVGRETKQLRRLLTTRMTQVKEQKQYYGAPPTVNQTGGRPTVEKTHQQAPHARRS